MTTKTTPILPFVATHLLTAATKTGDISELVMAVADPKNKSTRLYREAEAGAITLAPLWRLVGAIPESEMVFSELNTIQRDRKTNKTAALKRVTDVAWFEIHGDEVNAIRTTVKAIPPDMSAIERPSFVDVEPSDDGVGVDLVVEDAIVQALNAEQPVVVYDDLDKKIVEIATTPAPTKRPRVVTAKKPAAAKKPAKAASSKGGPRTLGVSTKSLSVAELQAEWTAITGLAAPSQSHQYMSHMVTGARRGRELLKAATSSVPAQVTAAA